MKKTCRLFALCGVVLACTMTVAWAETSKLSSQLQTQAKTGNNNDPVEVIVQYKVVPTEAHRQKVAKFGGKLHDRMDQIRGAHYTIPRSELQTLADDPDVAYISPNRPLQAMFDDITDSTVHSDWANAYGQTGEGIGVAIIDSGVVDLPDFHTGSTSRIVYQESFVGGTPADQFGHGTHVAGILAGNGNGTVYIGTTPRVNIINLRVLDANGQGTDADVIRAINRAIALKLTYNIRVINLSLGRPVFEPAALDPLCQAVEAAWKAGIVVVVAAGNEGRNNSANTQGYGTITAPGNDPYVITVGCIKSNGTSTRTDDLIASYSSKGPTLFDHYVKPDLVVPGNKIVSLVPPGLTLSRKYPGNRVTGNFFRL
ncbi:MAG: S8 family serine peptidase, partial [Acidobacteriota bacterium]